VPILRNRFGRNLLYVKGSITSLYMFVFMPFKCN
jgi:hypothetical protein